jgi:hypothetical protein
MEDSVGADERREQSETMPHKKARQEVAEAGGVGGGGGGKPAEEGGFLSAVASKIGATMSGANGGSGGEVGAAMASDGEEGKRDGDGEPGEEGGFLSAVASKIGAAMSGANGGSGGGGNAAAASGGEDKEADGFTGGVIFRKLLHSSPPAPPHVSGKDQGVSCSPASESELRECYGPVRLYRNKTGFIPDHQNLYKLEK